MEEYGRRPTPTTALQGTDGSEVFSADLTRQGPALIVFPGPTAEAHDVLAELPLWVRRLPKVGVAAVLPESLGGDVGGLRVRLLRDPQEQMRQVLAPGDAPMAVLFGTDDHLAGGPAVGLREIRTFIDDVEGHFATMFAGPRVLVTSAATGPYCCPFIALPQMREDRLLDVDFACFSEQSHPTRARAMHPRLAGKIPKMLAWATNPGYDYYVWIDSCFALTRPDAVAWFLDQVGDHDAVFFPHRSRTSVAAELEFVLSGMAAGDEYLLDRYGGEDIRNQVAAYLSDSTFEDSRLIEAGAFIYSSRIVQDARSNVMKEWFYQNCRWSVEDQLSLPYVLHLFDVDAVMIDAPSIYECEYLH